MSNTLAADNVKLAYRLANDWWEHVGRRHAGTPGLEYEEACGEALLSLVRAARMFDPGRGRKFGSYLGVAVRRGLGVWLDGLVAQRRGGRGQHGNGRPRRFVSLEAFVTPDGDPAAQELFADHREPPPWQRVASRDDAAWLGRLVRGAPLTPGERLVAVALLAGRELSPVARWVGVSRQALGQSKRLMLCKLRQAAGVA